MRMKIHRNWIFGNFEIRFWRHAGPSLTGWFPAGWYTLNSYSVPKSTMPVPAGKFETEDLARGWVVENYPKATLELVVRS